MKAKKILLLGVILTLSMMLCACGKEQDKATSTESVGTPIVTTEAPTTEAPTTEAPTNDTSAEYFFNETNYMPNAKNEVCIKPRYVYWEGDKLVAECFVINSFDTTVYNIDVETLSFSNDGGASEFVNGYFGLMEGASVPANSYIIWTFTFSGDAVYKYVDDLSTLRYHSSVNYKY